MLKKKDGININNLQIFSNEKFGELEVIAVEGKAYFAATESAKMLKYSNPQKAIRDHCKAPGVIKRSVGVQTGVKADGTPAIQYVEKNFISEGNLLRLITHSKMPGAEELESWIFDKVIPTVLHHGMYAVDQLLDDPDLAIRAFTALKEEREKRLAAEQQLQLNKPKVLFADAVSASSTSILIGDLAKLLKQNGYDTGQKRLFEWLRRNGYLIKSDDSKNMPTQKVMEQGLFEVKESTISNLDGSIRTTRTTKVTGKGQVYFINLLIDGEEKKGA